MSVVEKTPMKIDDTGKVQFVPECSELFELCHFDITNTCDADKNRP
jgi:hypothetical protein